MATNRQNNAPLPYNSPAKTLVRFAIESHRKSMKNPCVNVWANNEPRLIDWGNTRHWVEWEAKTDHAPQEKESAQ